jgi:monoamine oxidase
VTDLPICYTMFPKTEHSHQAERSERGVVMAAYTFQEDATSLGAMSPVNRTLIVARNLDEIFLSAKSLALLEASVAQVWSSDEMAGGSAFASFGPMQKTDFWKDMVSAEWGSTVFFYGGPGELYSWLDPRSLRSWDFSCSPVVYCCRSEPH